MKRGNSAPSHVLAVDLGGTNCSVAIIDRHGRVVARKKLPVDNSSASGPVLQITKLASELARSTGFRAAGVAVPGLVRRDGTVWAPNLKGWNRMPLASRLMRALDTPVVVESDRNAAVLGECWRGAARGKSDVIVLMIGTGIGAGILSGGRIVRGAHELSGCAGWLTVTGEETPESSQMGELESLTAGPAIARHAKAGLAQGRKSILSELNREALTTLDVATAARRGDALSREIFQTCGRLLGLGVANLVSVFDPEIIVIGGGMAGAADLFLDALKKGMLERAQPLAAKQVKIAVSKLGDAANLLGCARLAWEAAGVK